MDPQVNLALQVHRETCFDAFGCGTSLNNQTDAFALITALSRRTSGAPFRLTRLFHLFTGPADFSAGETKSSPLFTKMLECPSVQFILERI